MASASDLPPLQPAVLQQQQQSPPLQQHQQQQQLPHSAMHATGPTGHPSALPSYMLSRLASPAGSETTIQPDAAECAQLPALDTADLQHSTPEVGTPDIANLQCFMDNAARPPSLSLPPPMAAHVATPLEPNISSPISQESSAFSSSAPSPSFPPVNNTTLPQSASNQTTEGGHFVSSTPAAPVLLQHGMASFEQAIVEPGLAPLPPPPSTLDNTTLSPPSEPDSTMLSSGLTVTTPKRTLPISPLALISAVADDEYSEVATPALGSSVQSEDASFSNQISEPQPAVETLSELSHSLPPEQRNDNDPSHYQNQNQNENQYSEEPQQVMGAGMRSRAVVSAMTPNEIDQVLQNAATRLVQARQEREGSDDLTSDMASDSDLSGAESTLAGDPKVANVIEGTGPQDAMENPSPNPQQHQHHHPPPHLSRTNSESTDVLISHPVSVETSRHNSDDEDEGGNHGHSYHHHQHQQHHHHDPSSMEEWTQRRQPTHAFHIPPFQLQQPPQQQGNTKASSLDDAQLRKLTDSLQRQQLGSDSPLPTPGALEQRQPMQAANPPAPSTPGPSISPAVVADTTAMAMGSRPASPAPPSRQSSQIFSLKKKDKDASADPKLSPKKTSRDTSHGIFHDLKRFFNVGSSPMNSPAIVPTAAGGYMEAGGSGGNGTATPPVAPSLKSRKSGLLGDWAHGSGSGNGGAMTPGTESPRPAGPHGNSIETDLRKKYGKLGKVLGRGAGGTVRILSRSSDNKVFAIKQFRKRRPNESERSYVKKVTSEYCLGSTFHHPNIIETLDIVKESGSYFEVMEFCKYELFSAVMSGLMGRDEVACCFRGIVDGVAYLHGLGVAHRDLKLDNCVMNERGIVKIIDFGCSMVFQLPFDKKIQLAKGVSGSDPYIAPELFTTEQHDARLADVWSMGIIFLCMTLRRFPWRIPKADQDPSFQAFANPDGTGKLRLLKLMPRESRPIMSRILEMDPAKRVLITEVLEDPWMKNMEHCRMDYMSPNHPHHLGDDGTVAYNPNEGMTVIPPSINGSETGRSGPRSDAALPQPITPYA